MGASDDGAHSQNEKIDVRNYIEGTKLLAAYLYEVSKITPEELQEQEAKKWKIQPFQNGNNMYGYIVMGTL